MKHLNQIVHADALTFLQGLPDASVDLIATDPPYNMRKAEWDTFDSDAALVAWLGEHFRAMRRVLKPNGSIYVFTAAHLSARVEIEIGRWFNVLNNIRWVKKAGWHERNKKDELRAFLSPHETIIFAEQFNSDNFARGESSYTAKCDELRGFVYEPLRAYLDGERVRAGVSFEQVRQIVGCAPGSGLPSHWFTKSQWILPTAENYAKLREGFNRNNGNAHLRREYDDLRREYDDLRRPFNATPDAPHTDVWDFATVGAYDGKHPAEKPLAMMQHIVRMSSKPGGVVLDPFCGSGPTLFAAKTLGRDFIGCDSDKHWAARARRKVAEPFAPIDGNAGDALDDLPLFAHRQDEK